MSVIVPKLQDWHEMVPLIKSIYARNCVGCCWHIVLDDQNVADSHVEFCINYAQEHGQHPDCMALGPLMLRASRTQRLRAAGART